MTLLLLLMHIALNELLIYAMDSLDELLISHKLLAGKLFIFEFGCVILFSSLK